MFTRGFRHGSAGNTELEMAKGMADSEPSTRDGLRQGGEGDGRQRNTYTLGHCAQLCRLCTAQRAPHLRNHGLVYLNDNFPADSGKVSCSPHTGGFQLFSHKVFCAKDVHFKCAQRCLTDPWQPCTETRKGRALSPSLLHTLTHTPTLGQGETKRRTKEN